MSAPYYLQRPKNPLENVEDKGWQIHQAPQSLSQGKAESEDPPWEYIAPVAGLGAGALALGGKHLLKKMAQKRLAKDLPPMPPPGREMADDEIEALMAQRFGPRLSEQPLPAGGSGGGSSLPPLNMGGMADDSLPPLPMTPGSASFPVGVGPKTVTPGGSGDFFNKMKQAGYTTEQIDLDQVGKTAADNFYDALRGLAKKGTGPATVPPPTRKGKVK